MGISNKKKNNFDFLLTTNNLRDFRSAIENLPRGNLESNARLIDLAQMGDEAAREELILSNLGLVIFIIQSNYKAKTDDDMLEQFQEGFLILIEAIDSFDKTKGVPFSAYISKLLKTKYKTNLQKIKSDVYKSKYFNALKSKYWSIFYDCERLNKPLPSDEELIARLHTTRDMLDIIKDEQRLTPMSIDKSIDSDNEDDQGFDVPIDDVNYKLLEDSIAQDEFSAYLKIYLPACDYYVAYNLYLKEGKETFESLASRLHVSSSMIQRIVERIVKKVKTFYDEFGNFIGSIPTDIRQTIYDKTFNFEPITPEEIVEYLFIKNNLTPLEDEYMRLVTFSSVFYTSHKLSTLLGINIDDLKKLARELKEKLEWYFKEHQCEYREFLNETLNHYKTQIFKIDIDSLSGQDYLYTQKFWKDRTFADCVAFIHDKKENISPKFEDKLRLYFGATPKEIVDPNRLEAKINFLRAGFYDRTEIPKVDLAKTFKKYRSYFTSQQIDDISAFLEPADGSQRNSNKYTSEINGYSRLLSLHFGLQDYKHVSLNRQRYRFIKNLVRGKVKEEYLQLLDAHYANPEGVMNRDIKNATSEVINAYIGVSTTRSIDLDYYRALFKANKDKFKNPQDRVLSLFLLEGQTQEEIVISTGIKPDKISNLIGDGLYKLDIENYKIMNELEFSKDELLDTLSTSKQSDELKSALEARIKGADENTVSANYGIPIQKLRQGLSDLKNKTKTRLTSSIELGVDEIEHEVNEEPYANILSKKAQLILSYLYGIKSVYNTDGLKYTVNEIADILGINPKRVRDYHNQNIVNLKLKKMGLLKSETDLLTKDEIELLMSDTHLPISAKEKETLYYLYGIDTNKAHTIEEVIAHFEMDESSIRYRLRHGAILIKKYKENKLAGRISYEEDVLPYAKYFTHFDRQILELLFLKHVTIDNLAELNGWSHDEALTYSYHLRFNLQLLKDGMPQGLDFDAFYGAVKKDEVPFYGNKNLAQVLFDLYYEHNLSYPEIREKYYPEMNVDAIKKNVEGIILAVMKYLRYGIIKTHDYSYEHIRDYFLEYNDKMTLSKKSQYCAFFRKIRPYSISSKRMTPLFICKDIMQNDGEYVRLDELDKKTVEILINKYRDHFTRRELETLCFIKKIHPRTILSGKEKRQILDFLMSTPKPNKKFLLGQKQKK